jgi:membrane associated rhomboid family serine protease
MILPIGDLPNPRGTPYVNYALLGINVVVFLVVSLPLMYGKPDANDPLLMEFARQLAGRYPGLELREIAASIASRVSAYDLFVLRWGYIPDSPSIFTLFTSMFLHGGWMHLLGNMLFLWIYGDNVEHRLGRIGYLIGYLATGTVATLAFGVAAKLSGGGNVPLVGASGAISGILGFYFLWFPRNKVRLLVFLFPFLMDVFLVGARWVLGFYLLIENVLPFILKGSGGGGVAHGAHIGGFVAGLIGAYLVDRISAKGGIRQAVSFEGKNTGQGRMGVKAHHVQRDLHQGLVGEAVRGFLKLSAIQRRTVPIGDVLELAQALAGKAQHDAALAVYRRALTDHPRGPGLDRIFLGIGSVLLYGKHRPTAAYQYFMDALDADPEPDVELSVRQGLKTIAEMQKHQFRGR